MVIIGVKEEITTELTKICGYLFLLSGTQYQGGFATYYLSRDRAFFVKTCDKKPVEDNAKLRL